MEQPPFPHGTSATRRPRADGFPRSGSKNVVFNLQTLIMTEIMIRR
jgi:hypothetical protein